MADILPFRALQFSRDRVPVEKVVTQPYDKITPEMQARYRESHPNNIVRVLRPASEPAEGELSPYERAADYLRRWRREGVIEQVSEPSLYAYFQTFRTPDDDTLHTRKGFVALCRLEDYANKVVFPHERTLTGPKKDRLELLRQTRTHFGQVFMIYSDPDRRVDAILDEVAGSEPHFSVRDEYEVEHKLWPVPEAGRIGAIRREMADKSLIIADGHHRYETALAFRDEMRESLGLADAGAYEWLMTTLVNMDSPGMRVLPTHRVVSNLASYDPARFLERARDYFEVAEVQDAAALESRLAEAGRAGPAIGVAAAGIEGFRLLSLRQGVDVAAIASDVSSRQAALDVVVLHRLVLEQCLGISEEDVRSESYVTYHRGLNTAVEEVRSGRAQAGFLLNPTRLEQMRDIALGGEVLPQKSTDFYPKLLSGLLMYSMD